jgi:hypothetical protein
MVLNFTSTTVPLTGATTTVRCRTSALACNFSVTSVRWPTDLLRIGGDLVRPLRFEREDLHFGFADLLAQPRNRGSKEIWKDAGDRRIVQEDQ